MVHRKLNIKIKHDSKCNGNTPRLICDPREDFTQHSAKTEKGGEAKQTIHHRGHVNNIALLA